MKCLEFRRELTAGPRQLSASAREHALGCDACAGAARLAAESERRIEEALLVRVPDGLEERVLLRRGLRRSPRWRQWAVAAAVLAAVAVMVADPAGLRGPENGTASLAIAHVMHEPESFHPAAALQPAAFESALRELGGSGDVELGTLRYVRLCPLEDGGQGWHFVFETNGSLVTVLVVPQGRAQGSARAVTKGWTAFVRPVPKGYFAVVASSGEIAGQVAARLQDRIRWRS